MTSEIKVDNIMGKDGVSPVSFPQGINIPPGGIKLLPPGIILPFAGAVAPTNFLMLGAGILVSRVTYADLFAVIGTTFGAGDGVTTFQLPDTAGVVLRGVGTAVGYSDAPIVTLGQKINDAIRNIVGQFKASGISGGIDSCSGVFSQSGSDSVVAGGPGSGGYGVFNASTVVPTASENRVKSIGVNHIIST